jgi:hypothetical protein
MKWPLAWQMKTDWRKTPTLEARNEEINDEQKLKWEREKKKHKV